jgi:hypothetical protein
MMPMPMRRKTRDMEKVENLCRTATAWKILPARRNKPDHGCAIRCAPKGWLARHPASVCPRRRARPRDISDAIQAAAGASTTGSSSST